VSLYSPPPPPEEALQVEDQRVGSFYEGGGVRGNMSQLGGGGGWVSAVDMQQRGQEGGHQEGSESLCAKP